MRVEKHAQKDFEFVSTLPKWGEDDAFDAEELANGLDGHQLFFCRHVEQNQTIKSVNLTNLKKQIKRIPYLKCD